MGVNNYKCDILIFKLNNINYNKYRTIFLNNSVHSGHLFTSYFVFGATTGNGRTLLPPEATPFPYYNPTNNKQTIKQRGLPGRSRLPLRFRFDVISSGTVP